MRDYRLDILGISECRWTGSGKIKIGDGVEILYSGMPEGGPHVHGVALMLSQNTAKSLLEFKPVNERLITARLQRKHGSMCNDTYRPITSLKLKRTNSTAALKLW